MVYEDSKIRRPIIGQLVSLADRLLFAQDFHDVRPPAMRDWRQPRPSWAIIIFMSGNFYEQVYAVVRRIPCGKVTTYGRVAEMLGRPRAARAVGYALNALKDKQGPAYESVPWQRVINSQGRISIVNREHSAQQQADMLRSERVEVTPDLRIDLDQFLWGGLHLVEIDDILHPQSLPED